jgi:hypothetical protein
VISWCAANLLIRERSADAELEASHLKTEVKRLPTTPNFGGAPRHRGKRKGRPRVPNPRMFV